MDLFLVAVSPWPVRCRAFQARRASTLGRCHGWRFPGAPAGDEIMVAHRRVADGKFERPVEHHTAAAGAAAVERRTRVLDAIEPVPVVYVNLQDLEALGVEAGSEILAKSRRGELRAYARPDAALKRGEVFIPFCYQEAAANLLTNEALDPFGKIPEFKYCAIRLEAA